MTNAMAIMVSDYKKTYKVIISITTLITTMLVLPISTPLETYATFTVGSARCVVITEERLAICTS